jgi:hypothetical protein
MRLRQLCELICATKFEVRGRGGIGRRACVSRNRGEGRVLSTETSYPVNIITTRNRQRWRRSNLTTENQPPKPVTRVRVLSSRYIVSMTYRSS